MTLDDYMDSLSKYTNVDKLTPIMALEAIKQMFVDGAASPDIVEGIGAAVDVYNDRVVTALKEIVGDDDPSTFNLDLGFNFTCGTAEIVETSQEFSIIGVEMTLMTDEGDHVFWYYGRTNDDGMIVSLVDIQQDVRHAENTGMTH